MDKRRITSATLVQQRVAVGATWTIGAYGVQKVLAFGSTLVLTRLLAPEAFGLMSLVSIFGAGLEMLSDTGTGPAIIYAKRGDAPEFLDTAWSIQIVRGSVMYLLSLLLAYPVAHLYNEPRLVPLLGITCIGLALRGFSAMRPQLLNRQVVLGRITLLDLVAQTVTIGTTIAAAITFRSVWALVIGSLLGDVARVWLSFAILPGPPHHFRIDRAAASEIMAVGRWVLPTTALAFAAGYLDRLVMGRLLSVRDLGIYGIATMIVISVTHIGRTVGTRVLFPVLAETARTSPNLLQRRLLRARLAWVVPTTLALWILSASGDLLIRLLYTPSFHAAGWMLRVLAMGATVAVLNQSSSILWPALGEFRTVTVLTAVQLIALLAALLVGHQIAGATGFVVGCAAAELLIYPVHAVFLARRGHWQWQVDAPLLALSALVTGLSIGAKPIV